MMLDKLSPAGRLLKHMSMSLLGRNKRLNRNMGTGNWVERGWEDWDLGSMGQLSTKPKERCNPPQRYVLLLQQS